MKIYKKEQKTITTTALEKVICDKCKQPIPIIYRENIEGVSLNIDAGYGSKFDSLGGVGSPQTFDICDNCCEELLKLLGCLAK